MRMIVPSMDCRRRLIRCYQPCRREAKRRARIGAILTRQIGAILNISALPAAPPAIDHPHCHGVMAPSGARSRDHWLIRPTFAKNNPVVTKLD
jgi:hypothetical protein